MHTLLFRSRESILQSDEPDLVRDVCFDIDRAQGKLERIRARIESLQEYAATEIQLLRDADAKLSAALVAALLSTRGQRMKRRRRSVRKRNRQRIAAHARRLRR
jgi:hypothetical protein